MDAHQLWYQELLLKRHHYHHAFRGLQSHSPHSHKSLAGRAHALWSVPCQSPITNHQAGKKTHRGLHRGRDRAYAAPAPRQRRPPPAAPAAARRRSARYRRRRRRCHARRRRLSCRRGSPAPVCRCMPAAAAPWRPSPPPATPAAGFRFTVKWACGSKHRPARLKSGWQSETSLGWSR